MNNEFRDYMLGAQSYLKNTPHVSSIGDEEWYESDHLLQGRETQLRQSSTSILSGNGQDADGADVQPRNSLV